MKYKNGFGVSIPYYDENGVLCRNMLSTNDSIDHRRVKRGLRKWVLQNTQRKLDSFAIRALMKSVRRHSQPMQYMGIRKRMDSDG